MARAFRGRRALYDYGGSGQVGPQSRNGSGKGDVGRMGLPIVGAAKLWPTFGALGVNSEGTIDTRGGWTELSQEP